MATSADTRVSTVTYRDDGIVFVDCWEGVDFTEDDARDTLALIDELTGSATVPHCVDLRRIKSMDRKARTVFAGGTHTKGAALVTGSPLSRVIGNFFLGLSKSDFPLRLFSDADDGIDWLRHL
jgi:hypothetical protein